jgi:hypothetical protein
VSDGPNTPNLTSNPVLAAGGLRMMAKHLGNTIDARSAHPDRLDEVADDMESLLRDAVRLCGEDQHDRHLRDRAEYLRSRSLDKRNAAGRSGGES